MYKALVLKELRETAGIAALALLAYCLLVMSQMGYDVPPFFYHQGREKIPFLDSIYISWFICISVVFSTVLGLWQTVVESYRGTWPYLLHRPMDLRKLIGVKMAVGAGVYLIVSAVPTLIYAAWASLPGTHASPFFWWMTEPTWLCWIVIVVCYLGAFLAGVRPGRWFGTRLLPVPAAYLMAALILCIRFQLRTELGTLIALVIVCAFFINMILFAVRTRDFS
jgi:hypothetical protein